MDELRDPRAFKVLDDDYGVTFPKDDAVLAAILKGDRPGGEAYATERYRTGQTIPAGRLPLSAAGVLEARGVVEAVAAKTSAPQVAAPALGTAGARPAARAGGGA